MSAEPQGLELEPAARAALRAVSMWHEGVDLIVVDNALAHHAGAYARNAAAFRELARTAEPQAAAIFTRDAQRNELELERVNTARDQLRAAGAPGLRPFRLELEQGGDE